MNFELTFFLWLFARVFFVKFGGITSEQSVKVFSAKSVFPANL